MARLGKDRKIQEIAGWFADGADRFDGDFDDVSYLVKLMRSIVGNPEPPTPFERGSIKGGVVVDIESRRPRTS